MGAVLGAELGAVLGAVAIQGNPKQHLDHRHASGVVGGGRGWAARRTCEESERRDEHMHASGVVGGGGV